MTIKKERCMLEKLKVVVEYTRDFVLDPHLLDGLRSDFPELDIAVYSGKTGASPAFAEASVFVGFPDDGQLAAMPQLRWVQLPSAGANEYAARPSLRPDVRLTTGRGVFGVPAAEHTLALMLAVAREIPVHVRQQDRKIWKRNEQCLELFGSTVGIIGLGDIGLETAKRAKAFGMTVLGVKRTASAPPDCVDELIGIAQLNDILPRCDFVVMSVPYTPETHRMIGAAQFALMKPGAVFVNVGRGATVDEAALVQALRDGRLAAAALDVTEKEPLPADSPLWDMPNVIISSHSIMIFPKKNERRAELLRQNLRRFLDGEPLLNEVNRALGY